ncbi:MAG: glycosyltransferase family 2 protein [Planctomycetes bacterium]|nr:glycosyltransferase family 2 protein [Planctomycetota bacterium]
MEPALPTITVVVPAYNSEASLPGLVERLEPVLRAHSSRFELILVNDGSRDSSWKVIQELVGKHSFIRGIDMLRNFGQHNAILCGIRAARHELIVTMDDDLQHPPEELPRLLARLTPDCDVVYGSPEHEQHGLLRNLASQMTKLALQKSMGAETARSVSALRVFRTALREAFTGYKSQYVSIDVLLTWATTRFASVRVRHDERRLGQSNYTYRKLVVHALNMITGFSTLPLQLASWIGFAFTLFGLGVLVFVVVSYFRHGSPVAGFPFLASIIAIFSGAQLFALGIIGEYLARMHFRMMDRPSYAVRDHIGGA